MGDLLYEAGLRIMLVFFAMVGVLLVAGFIFTVAAYSTGKVQEEYRCRFGVIESRTTYFGTPLINAYEPIDGDASSEGAQLCR